MKTVRIHQGKALPLQIRFIALLLLGVAIVVTMDQLPQPFSIGLAILLATLVPAVWFATDVLFLDIQMGSLFEGTWVMGFKFGKETSFKNIERIFVKKVKTRQTMYSLSNRQHIATNYEYHAFLTLDTGETFFMVSHPLKERLIKKCQLVIQKLKLRDEILALPTE